MHLLTFDCMLLLIRAVNAPWKMFKYAPWLIFPEAALGSSQWRTCHLYCCCSSAGGGLEEAPVIVLDSDLPTPV
jgi:hypothetical protein